jgi:hypothetical protein
LKLRSNNSKLPSLACKLGGLNIHDAKPNKQEIENRRDAERKERT